MSAFSRVLKALGITPLNDRISEHIAIQQPMQTELSAEEQGVLRERVKNAVVNHAKYPGFIADICRYLDASKDWELLFEIGKTWPSLAQNTVGEMRKMKITFPREIEEVAVSISQENIKRKNQIKREKPAYTRRKSQDQEDYKPKKSAYNVSIEEVTRQFERGNIDTVWERKLALLLEEGASTQLLLCLARKNVESALRVYNLAFTRTHKSVHWIETALAMAKEAASIPVSEETTSRTAVIAEQIKYISTTEALLTIKRARRKLNGARVILGLNDAWQENLKKWDEKPVHLYEAMHNPEWGKRIQEFASVKAQESLIRQTRAEQELLAASGMQDYLAFFPQARALKRNVVFHAGPTNSGKTYTAMQQLFISRTGTYLAPLRLLALEGYDRMVEKGLDVALATGDEKAGNSINPTHISSTIEMLDTEQTWETVVIDEVQMLQDTQRGWAWTRALVGAATENLILLGSPEVIPMVENLCRLTGDQLSIVRHQRMSRLQTLESISLKNVRKGDAIVAFSRSELFDIRESLSSKYSVSMLYGALSPEVRRAEAERFRTGESDLLVASDAIGMGLNLPLERIFLASGNKYDGISRRPLKESEIRQICGRSGRGTKDGWAGFIKGSEDELAPKKLQAILDRLSDLVNIKPFVMPPFSAVKVAAKQENHENLAELLKMLSGQAMGTEHFMPANLDSFIKVAEGLQAVPLTLEERYMIAMAPVSDEDISMLAAWSEKHTRGENVLAPIIDSTRLQSLEKISRRLTAWMWLAYRLPQTFVEIETAQIRRVEINQLIEAKLRKRTHVDYEETLLIQLNQEKDSDTTDELGESPALA